MLESPFPASFGFAALDVFEDHAALVHPEELALLSARAVDKRRRELIGGRAAARRALRKLGCSDAQPILRGPRGQPLWPFGVVGSITHAGGVAAAVAAWDHEARGLGLDVEDLDAKVGRDVTRLVCLPDEAEWIEEGADWNVRFKLLFSAKECVFKALYPIGGVELDFKDAHLVSRAEGFDVTLLRRASPELPAGASLRIEAVVRGRYVISSLVYR